MEQLTMYNNRKIYSKARSRYLNLTEIRHMLVTEKVDIQVTKHDTNEDVTTRVLTQALSQSLKLDYTKLKDLIIASN